MDPDNSTGQDPGRIQELELELERLREENATLREERDRAVKAQDALLEKVLPLAVPRDSPRDSSPPAVTRILTLVMCILLLLAVVLAAHYYPRIMRSVSSGGSLPANVRVQEQP